MSGNKMTVSAMAGIIGAIVDTLLGGWCYHITVLLILMCIDFIMGLLIAAFWGKSQKSKNGGLSSMECWRGLVKKICTLLVVAAAYQADRLIGIDFAKTAVVIGFCVSEIISICENARIMGIMPDAVKKIFDKMLDIMKNGKGDMNDNNK